MKIEKITNYSEMTSDAFVADYTNQTNSHRKVEILSTKPQYICIFHLKNPNEISYWAVNLEENASLLKGSEQCECMFAANKAKRKGWVCLVELKYCMEKNIENNATHAYNQLRGTFDKLIELEILDIKTHRIYLNISVPEHSHKEPFTAFLTTQDEMLDKNKTDKINLLGYNEALILNEGFIRIPKGNI